MAQRRNPFLGNQFSHVSLFDPELRPDAVVESPTEMIRENLPPPIAPEHSRLRELLANTPSREDHSPSTKRRILAAAVGGLEGYSKGAGAGVEAAGRITDAPYNRAMKDYQGQLQNAGTLAQIDRENFNLGSENYRAQLQHDPRFTAAREQASLEVQEPFKIDEDQRNVAGRIEVQDAGHDNTIDQLEQKQVDALALQNAQNEFVEGETTRKIQSTEDIAEASNQTRVGLAKIAQEKNIPIEEQELAAFAAEDEILSSLEFSDITENQLKRIAEKTQDGRWILKDGALVDPEFRETWKYYKKLSEEKALERLNLQYGEEENEEEIEFVPVGEEYID